MRLWFTTKSQKGYNAKSPYFRGFKVVIALGFEPRTACLEGRCSIQLSYATFYILTKYIFSRLQ